MKKIAPLAIAVGLAALSSSAMSAECIKYGPATNKGCVTSFVRVSAGGSFYAGGRLVFTGPGSGANLALSTAEYSLLRGDGLLIYKEDMHTRGGSYEVNKKFTNTAVSQKSFQSRIKFFNSPSSGVFADAYIKK